MATQTELVAGARRFSPIEHDLHQLLALHRLALLVRQRCDDAFCFRVDHLARRGIGVFSVQAEGDPAWLIAQRDGADLLWRYSGGIKDVDAAVEAVVKPEFFLIRGQADTVARAA